MQHRVPPSFETTVHQSTDKCSAGVVAKAAKNLAHRRQLREGPIALKVDPLSSIAKNKLNGNQ